MANLKSVFLICLVSITSSVLISLFFFFFPPLNFEKHVPHGSNEVLERNYDGPIYVVLAKTLYNQIELQEINFNSLPTNYYANHFPLLPTLIRLTSLTGNYFRSLILINWIFAALFAACFYFFLKKFKISEYPLFLSLISLFIPPRWLAVRTVGGSEPVFLLILIICLYYWFEKKYAIASIFMIFLVLTRPPGFFFFFSFLALILYQWHNQNFKTAKLLKIIKEKWTLILMPLTILGLFLFFKFSFGDFWAYFKSGTGTNVHFQWIPFASVLNYNSPVSEGFLYLFAVYVAGIYLLWKQNQKQLAIFCLVYLIPNFFMYVDDIYRYLIPISPFCLVIGYQNLFKQRVFRYLFPLFLIGIYIYTLNLLPNRMFNYDDYAKLRIIINLR